MNFPILNEIPKKNFRKLKCVRRCMKPTQNITYISSSQKSKIILFCLNIRKDFFLNSRAKSTIN